MQQPVRVEGVVDAAALAHVEGEPERRGTLADRGTIGLELFLAHAVLAHQVFVGVLALGLQLRIQLERLQVDFRLHGSVQLRECLLQAGQADGAPRAGDVGNEVDAKLGWGSHGCFAIWEALDLGPMAQKKRVRFRLALRFGVDSPRHPSPRA
jgi:hypothetical protein